MSNKVHRAITYEPKDLNDEVQIRSAARNCGQDLGPDDERAKWIDDLPKGYKDMALESYKKGQGEALDDLMFGEDPLEAMGY